jgi:Xaa-Pro aminopeptidase
MSYRLDKLRSILKEKELDALLVSTSENRRYLSGFHGSAGSLLVSGEDAFLATDFRYVEQAANQAPEFQVLKVGAGWSWLMDLLRDTGLKKVGFESQQVTVATYQQMVEAVRDVPAAEQPSLVATSSIVEELRTVKDGDELEMMQRAVDVADAAMDSVTPTVQAGQTEQEVAWRLEVAMRDLGAESVSFETIVAAGPNGAMPHHRPSERVIDEGEPVVIDMGAKVDGYCSDITRTICVGESDETFRRIYDIVLGSQLTAIATVTPGLTGGDADELSRAVISEAGYGDNFGHSLGHGIGMAVHEFPRVGPKSENTLSEGMVFTVEPGIYLSGWGGVRIEDMVILEGAGARVLSKARK